MNPVYFLSTYGSKVYFELFHDLKIDGKENIPDGPCLFTPNHISFLDPPLIAVIHSHAEIAFIARKTLFSLPILSWLLPQINVFPIDQEKPDLAGLKRIITKLQTGQKVVLFPEGSRSWDGKVQPAMPGVGFVVAKANVPVIPIKITGCYEAWPRGGKLKLFVPVRAIIGKPLHFQLSEKPTKADYKQVGEDIMKAIEAI